MESYQRRQLLKFLAAASATSLITPSQAGPTGRPSKLSNIHHAHGDIKINGQALTPATLIKAGDEVTTGENTEFIFRFGLDAHLMRSNSSMQLEAEEDSSIVDTLRIISGAILSVFGRANKRILTPVATIGIRGTGTYFEVQDSETYLCTCYGGTDIRSNLDPSITDKIDTHHHESPRYIRNTSEGSLIEEAPVKNHSDAELILLESTLGRRPPFTTDSTDSGFSY